MKRLPTYWQLLRLPNLLIVGMTMYLMRYFVVLPLLEVYPFSLQLSSCTFAALVGATTALTAAGYVINDYFDHKTDMVNRPQRVVVGVQISRREAMAWHLVLNTLGVLLGFYVAWKISLWQIGFIFPLVAGLLWYYSTTYKKVLILGNLIVSFLVGLVPMMVILFEIPVLNRVYYSDLLQLNTSLSHLFFWVGGFGFFAFLTTLVREIIKDAEDFEGDQAYGRNTLPVAAGMQTTKGVIAGLLLIGLAALAWVHLQILPDALTRWYFLLALALPMAYVLYKSLRAQSKTAFHHASIAMKFLMLGGIAYAPVLKFIITP